MRLVLAAGLVVQHLKTFAVFDRHGDILPEGMGEEGIYHRGTRHLSAAQFVHEQRDALALVASQDRRFTVFTWGEEEGMVLGYRVEALLL